MKSLGAAAMWAAVVYGVDQIYFAGRCVASAAQVMSHILGHLF